MTKDATRSPKACANPACDVVFAPRTGNQSYCSQTCNHAHRAAKRDAERRRKADRNAPAPYRLCKWSGRPFTIGPENLDQEFYTSIERIAFYNFCKGWAGKFAAGADDMAQAKKIGPILTAGREFNRALKERIKQNWAKTEDERDAREAAYRAYREGA